MCLGMPGRIVDVHGSTATVDFWGVYRIVRLETMEERVEPGDYIVTHLGYATRRIPDEAVTDTLAMYEIVLAEEGIDPLEANQVLSHADPSVD